MTDAAAAGLDHVGLVGSDLGEAIAALRRLGFSPTAPRVLSGHDPATGATVSLGQSSAHAVFRSGYVELSAVEHPTAQHHLAAYLGRPGSLKILAFGVDDVAAAQQRCTAAGVRVRAICSASRSVEYGRRHGTARFEWFMLEPDDVPEGLLCCVRHRTPELLFQPEVQQHPNGAQALAGVYVLASSATALARRYAAITGTPANDGELALPGGWVRVLDSRAFEARFPGAGLTSVPGLAGFAVRVEDPGAALQRLARSGVVPGGRTAAGFWIRPQDAAGCVLEFVS
jgi:catechol 2,3-dioxygenase-like lactoylglutathione lyase family enzyme